MPAPRVMVTCPCCGWSGKRAQKERPCPACGHWYPGKPVRPGDQRCTGFHPKPANLTECRVPGCGREAVYKERLLCRRHRDRARYRVEQGFTWEYLLSPAGLQYLVRRVDEPHLPRDPLVVWDMGDGPTMRSCLTCENLAPLAPRYLACAKKHWPHGVKQITLRQVESWGLPEILQGFARNCPYYAAFRRGLPTHDPTKAGPK